MLRVSTATAATAAVTARAGARRQYSWQRRVGYFDEAVKTSLPEDSRSYLEKRAAAAAGETVYRTGRRGLAVRVVHGEGTHALRPPDGVDASSVEEDTLRIESLLQRLATTPGGALGRALASAAGGDAARALTHDYTAGITATAIAIAGPVVSVTTAVPHDVIVDFGAVLNAVVYADGVKHGALSALGDADITQMAETLLRCEVFKVGVGVTWPGEINTIFKDGMGPRTVRRVAFIRCMRSLAEVMETLSYIDPTAQQAQQRASVLKDGDVRVREWEDVRPTPVVPDRPRRAAADPVAAVEDSDVPTTWPEAGSSNRPRSRARGSIGKEGTFTSSTIAELVLDGATETVTDGARGQLFCGLRAVVDDRDLPSPCVLYSRVLAEHVRRRVLRALAERYPEYDFDHREGGGVPNPGAPSQAHIHALCTRGAIPGVHNMAHPFFTGDYRTRAGDAGGGGVTEGAAVRPISLEAAGGPRCLDPAVDEAGMGMGAGVHAATPHPRTGVTDEDRGRLSRDLYARDAQGGTMDPARFPTLRGMDGQKSRPAIATRAREELEIYAHAAANPNPPLHERAPLLRKVDCIIDTLVEGVVGGRGEGVPPSGTGSPPPQATGFRALFNARQTARKDMEANTAARPSPFSALDVVLDMPGARLHAGAGTDAGTATSASSVAANEQESAAVVHPAAAAATDLARETLAILRDGLADGGDTSMLVGKAGTKGKGKRRALKKRKTPAKGDASGDGGPSVATLVGGEMRVQATTTATADASVAVQVEDADEPMEEVAPAAVVGVSSRTIAVDSSDDVDMSVCDFAMAPPVAAPVDASLLGAVDANAPATGVGVADSDDPAVMPAGSVGAAFEAVRAGTADADNSNNGDIPFTDAYGADQQRPARQRHNNVESVVDTDDVLGVGDVPPRGSARTDEAKRSGRQQPPPYATRVSLTRGGQEDPYAVVDSDEVDIDVPNAAVHGHDPPPRGGAGPGKHVFRAASDPRSGSRAVLGIAAAGLGAHVRKLGARAYSESPRGGRGGASNTRPGGTGTGTDTTRTEHKNTPTSTPPTFRLQFSGVRELWTRAVSAGAATIGCLEKQVAGASVGLGGLSSTMCPSPSNTDADTGRWGASSAGSPTRPGASATSSSSSNAPRGPRAPAVAGVEEIDGSGAVSQRRASASTELPCGTCPADHDAWEGRVHPPAARARPAGREASPSAHGGSAAGLMRARAEEHRTGAGAPSSARDAPREAALSMHARDPPGVPPWSAAPEETIHEGLTAALLQARAAEKLGNTASPPDTAVEAAGAPATLSMLARDPLGAAQPAAPEETLHGGLAAALMTARAAETRGKSSCAPTDAPGGAGAGMPTEATLSMLARDPLGAAQAAAEEETVHGGLATALMQAYAAERGGGTPRPSSAGDTADTTATSAAALSMLARDPLGDPQFTTVATHTAESLHGGLAAALMTARAAEKGATAPLSAEGAPSAATLSMLARDSLGAPHAAAGEETAHGGLATALMQAYAAEKRGSIDCPSTTTVDGTDAAAASAATLSMLARDPFAAAQPAAPEETLHGGLAAALMTARAVEKQAAAPSSATSAPAAATFSMLARDPLGAPQAAAGEETLHGSLAAGLMRARAAETQGAVSSSSDGAPAAATLSMLARDPLGAPQPAAEEETLHGGLATALMQAYAAQTRSSTPRPSSAGDTADTTATSAATLSMLARDPLGAAQPAAPEETLHGGLAAALMTARAAETRGKSSCAPTDAPGGAGAGMPTEATLSMLARDPLGAAQAAAEEETVHGGLATALMQAYAAERGGSGPRPAEGAPSEATLSMLARDPLGGASPLVPEGRLRGGSACRAGGDIEHAAGGVRVGAEPGNTLGARGAGDRASAFMTSSDLLQGACPADDETIQGRLAGELMRAYLSDARAAQKGVGELIGRAAATPPPPRVSTASCDALRSTRPADDDAARGPLAQPRTDGREEPPTAYRDTDAARRAEAAYHAKLVAAFPEGARAVPSGVYYTTPEGRRAATAYKAKLAASFPGGSSEEPPVDPAARVPTGSMSRTPPPHTTARGRPPVDAPDGAPGRGTPRATPAMIAPKTPEEPARDDLDGPLVPPSTDVRRGTSSQDLPCGTFTADAAMPCRESARIRYAAATAAGADRRPCGLALADATGREGEDKDDAFESICSTATGRRTASSADLPSGTLTAEDASTGRRTTPDVRGGDSPPCDLALADAAGCERASLQRARPPPRSSADLPCGTFAPDDATSTAARPRSWTAGPLDLPCGASPADATGVEERRVARAALTARGAMRGAVDTTSGVFAPDDSWAGASAAGGRVRARVRYGLASCAGMPCGTLEADAGASARGRGDVSRTLARTRVLHGEDARGVASADACGGGDAAAPVGHWRGGTGDLPCGEFPADADADTGADAHGDTDTGIHSYEERRLAAAYLGMLETAMDVEAILATPRAGVASYGAHPPGPEAGPRARAAGEDHTEECEPPRTLASEAASVAAVCAEASPAPADVLPPCGVFPADVVRSAPAQFLTAALLCLPMAVGQGRAPTSAASSTNTTTATTAEGASADADDGVVVVVRDVLAKRRGGARAATAVDGVAAGLAGDVQGLLKDVAALEAEMSKHEVRPAAEAVATLRGMQRRWESTMAATGGEDNGAGGNNAACEFDNVLEDVCLPTPTPTPPRESPAPRKGV